MMGMMKVVAVIFEGAVLSVFHALMSSFEHLSQFPENETEAQRGQPDGKVLSLLAIPCLVLSHILFHIILISARCLFN